MFFATDTVQLDPQVWNLVVGVLIPLLVGALAKFHAPAWFKSVMNLGLSALSGGITAALAASGPVDLKLLVWGAAQTWIVSVSTYYGLWKPSGVAVQVKKSTGSVGIGPKGD